jgi:hypothetical protein
VLLVQESAVVYVALALHRVSTPPDAQKSADYLQMIKGYAIDFLDIEVHYRRATVLDQISWKPMIPAPKVSVLVRCAVYRCLLLLLLGLLSAVSAAAQSSSLNRTLSLGNSAQSAANRQTAIRKSGRFLGWKFAARSGQDTTRWQRNVSQRSPAPTDEIVSVRRANLQPSRGPAASFANAGFGFRTGLPTGFIPTAAVEGDFNNDGKMDVAISNGGDNTVYVLLGKGDGTFQVPEVLYTQGQAPVWIAAADLRNSGHLDLAVVDADSSSIEVFLGNGDGTFQPGAQVSLPLTPTFVLAGDFNKDGKQDLAIGFVVPADATGPQFEILLGDGHGEFSGSIIPPPIETALDDVPTGWIAAADLNNDGSLDLVTTVTGGSGMAYLNQSGQSFLQGPFFGPEDGAMVVGLGDMNEDGCIDAVELGASGFVTIAKGTCDGNFTQAAPIAVAGDLEPAVKIVDINGDGHLDVVGSAAFYDLSSPAIGIEAGYLVSVLKGDGKGNLSPARIYRGGPNATRSW